jgi:hypothetical protein
VAHLRWKKKCLLMMGSDDPPSNLVSERSRLKEVGSQDLDVEKEITIYITHGNSVLIWLKDDPFSPIVISS